MKRISSWWTLVGIAATLVLVPVPAAHATWVGDHCYNRNFVDDHVRRKDAAAYAEVAFKEGYEWGGGCWNDDDLDDTPGQPDSGGEGPDCSGFTFKTWELKLAYGAGGFLWWDKIQNVHGPYPAADYHAAPPEGRPFFRIGKSRSTMIYMDAFASTGHIGMLWTESNPSAGTDYIAEAKGDSSGTGKFVETYRYQSEYVGVRRENWTPDCYPNCRQPQVEIVVVA